MKVIIEVNGKSQEVDANELNSVESIKTKIREVADQETKEVKDALAEAHAKEIKDALAELDTFGKIYELLVQRSLEIFKKEVIEYNKFKEENNIKTNLDLTESLNALHNCYINKIAIAWKRLDEFEGVQAEIKNQNPQMKAFVKYLESEYKRIFGKSKKNK